MPIYQYFCEKCEAEKEVIAKAKDPPPLCCCQDMKKKLVGSALRKGAGLYSFDHSNKSMGKYREK